MSNLTTYCYSLRTEQERFDFERQNGIELPSEFRTFLMTVRSGEPQSWWELLDHGYFPIGHEQPAAEFQFDTEDAQIVIRQRLSDDETFMWEEGPALEHHGYISLESSGCGWIDALVVTGEQRGLTWSGGNCCWFPYHDQSGRQYGFLEWYEHVYIPSREWLRQHHADQQLHEKVKREKREADARQFDEEFGEFKRFPIYNPRRGSDVR
jgi:hypothetical protein